jgi:hypothetical protein
VPQGKPKAKAPNPNIQAPEKFQEPNSKKCTGDLSFEACGFSGAWGPGCWSFSRLHFMIEF